jgi:hypothetical protein
LPIVAYIEAAHYFGRRGRRATFRRALEAAGVEIEWLRQVQAEAAIDCAEGKDDFSDHAGDYAIAGHVHAGRTLVTSNVKDFEFLPHVVRPQEIMARFPTRPL